METSDYIELAMLLIVLALCISLGVGITTSTHRKVREDNYNVAQNKNTKRSELTAETVNNEEMTYEDIILMVEVQDYQMSEPNEFTIVDNKNAIATIKLEDRYREQLMIYSQLIGGHLRSISNPKVAKYRVYAALAGELSNRTEMTYAIEVIK